MIRKIILLLTGILFLVGNNIPAFTQSFQQEVDGIPVMSANSLLHSPFSGGINESKPALVDIDDDGDLDLFIGEGEGRFQAGVAKKGGHMAVMTGKRKTKN